MTAVLPDAAPKGTLFCRKRYSTPLPVLFCLQVQTARRTSRMALLTSGAHGGMASRGSGSPE
jgi:hypothetical protein